MNFRPTRSLVRRLSPLAVLVVGLAVFFGHMAFADANTPKGNQIESCQGSSGFQSYYFTVDGKKVAGTDSASDLVGKTDPGDTVALHFKLFPGCSGLYVGIKSYTSNGKAVTKAGLNEDQKAFDGDARTYTGTDEHVVSVKLPVCYYQVDAYTGSSFDIGDYTNSGGPGFIAADYGGKTKDCSPPAPVSTPAKKPTTTTSTSTTMKPTTTTVKPTTTTSTSTTEKPKPTTTTTVKVFASSASVVQACKVGFNGFVISYYNKGKNDETFHLLINGKDVDSVKLGTDVSTSSEGKFYSFDQFGVAAGKDANIKVTVDDKQVGAGKVTNNCINETVDVKAQCNTAVGVGAVFTFVNKGTEDETFEVLDSNGKALPISPVAVAAGKTVTKTQVVADNAVTQFEIKGDNAGTDVTKTVTTSCVQVEATTIVPTTVPPTTIPATTTTSTTAPAQVEAATVTRPQLAFTGVDVFPEVFIGSVLMIFGLTLLLEVHHRRKAY